MEEKYKTLCLAFFPEVGMLYGEYSALCPYFFKTKLIYKLSSNIDKRNIPVYLPPKPKGAR